MGELSQLANPWFVGAAPRGDDGQAAGAARRRSSAQGATEAPPGGAGPSGTQRRTVAWADGGEEEDEGGAAAEEENEEPGGKRARVEYQPVKRVTRNMGSLGDHETAAAQKGMHKGLGSGLPVGKQLAGKKRVYYGDDSSSEDEDDESGDDEPGPSGGRRGATRAHGGGGQASHWRRSQATRIQPRRVMPAPKPSRQPPAKPGRVARRHNQRAGRAGNGGLAPQAPSQPLAEVDIEFDHVMHAGMRLDKGQAVYVLSPQGEANNGATDVDEDVCEVCKRNCRLRDGQASDDEEEVELTPLDVLLECEFCCRGWHPLCLQPPMTELPPIQTPFVCPDCSQVNRGGAGGSSGGALAPRVMRTALTASERFLRGDYYMGRIEKVILPKRSPLPMDPQSPAPTVEACQVVVRWFVRPEDTLQGRQLHQSRRLVFLNNVLQVVDGDCIIHGFTPEALMRDAFRATVGDDAFLLTHRYNENSAVYVPIRGSGANSDSEAEDDAADMVIHRAGGARRGAVVGWGLPSEDDDDDPSDDDDAAPRRNIRRTKATGGVPPASGPVLIQGLGAAAVDKHAPGGGGLQMDDNRAGVRFGQLNVGRGGALPPAPAPESGAGGLAGEAGPSSGGGSGGQDATQVMLDAARQCLALSCIPKSMPCRHEQRDQIQRIVLDALRGGNTTGSSMYISGVPGTGKTATVKEVMRRMRTLARADKLPPFFYVEVNGLRLPTPKHAYTCILEALTGERTAPERAQAILDARFAAPPVQGRVTVLFLDELDMLQTPSNSVLYNLFDWPSRSSAKLIVIAVANTIDLPERLPPRIISRMGVTRVRFNTYDKVQLQTIVKSRLEAAGEECVRMAYAEGPTPVVYICSRVANVSGDARRALELTRRAIEIMSARWRRQREEAAAAGQPAPRLALTMEDAKAANVQMVDSPHVQLIRAGTLHERIFMVSLALEARYTGVEVAVMEHVARRHQQLCSSHGIPVPPFGMLLDVACRLGECQLILCDSGRRRAAMRIRLTYSPQDVWAALKNEPDEQPLPDMPWVGSLNAAGN